MILSMLAFVGTRKENNIFSGEMEKAINAVGEASGFDMLIPVEGEEGWYSLSFSMVKNEGL